MDWKGHRQSTNVEDRRGQPEGEWSFNVLLDNITNLFNGESSSPKIEVGPEFWNPVKKSAKNISTGAQGQKYQGKIGNAPSSAVEPIVKQESGLLDVLKNEAQYLVSSAMAIMQDIQDMANNPVAILQAKLGVDPTGEWDEQTNGAMALKIAEVQLSPEYQKAYAEMYPGSIEEGVKIPPDFMPGPATLMAMKEMNMDPELIEATEKLMLMDRDQSNDLYEIPENPMELLAEVKAQMEKNVPVVPTPQPDSTNAMTPGGR